MRLPDRFRRLLRGILAGCFFAGFGIGGMLIGLIIFPPLRLFRAHLAMRAMVRLSYRFFAGAADLTGLFRVAVSPEDRARLAAARGVVVAANHITLIDVVILIAMLPDATSLAKAAAGRNAFYGALVRGAFLTNENPECVLRDGTALLRGGTSLVVFPEGTRGEKPPESPAALRRGAAQLAIRAGVPVLPVRIGCTPRVLGRGDKWWRVGSETVEWRITVGESLTPAPIDIAKPSHAAAVALTAQLYERLWGDA